MGTVKEVLTFWLEELEEKDWYSGAAELDAEIAGRFGSTWEAVHHGQLEHWRCCSEGALAYLLVTDQFSRNLHRGKPEAFATDARARQAAHMAVDRNWDQGFNRPERQFFYMPFCHSEILQDQEKSVRLQLMYMGPELDHARAHRWVIRQYGRFPYRNEALGRRSTAAETAFLEAGGYKAALEAVR